MKIAMLSASHSIHTVRWANALAERNLEIHLLTQHPAGDPLHPDVQVHPLRFRSSAGYFLNAWALRRHLKRIQPDLLHAHYASGYGTLARLSGFQPLLLSVWGADVYDVPQKSFLHRSLVARNLRAADWIASTSQCMARQTWSLAPELTCPNVTPFGADLQTFRPISVAKEANVVTVGTVKKLTAKYGIDVLIRGFARCRELVSGSGLQLRLRIVGGGPQRGELEGLARRLAVQDVVEFVGPVPHNRVCEELNRLDIYCAMSRLDSESFGVAVIEASACQVPVVVSDAGGLPEVVEDGKTGLIVPRENPEQTALALARLISDPGLRSAMGTAGRKFVEEHYEWNENVSRMVALYDRILGTTSDPVANPNGAEMRPVACWSTEHP